MTEKRETAPGACPAAPDIGERLREEELCPADLLKGQEEAYRRDIARLLARRDEFVDVACPACGSRAREAKFSKFSLTFVVCLDCGAIYMNPRPSLEVMASYYADSENYRYWAAHIFPASEGVREEKIHRPWLRRVVDYRRRYGASGGLLVEVGAGFGTFSALAAASGEFARVVAVEPNPALAAVCRGRGLEVIDKPIEAVSGSMAEADIVVSFEVLEHLFEPAAFLRQCARIVKPGGLLVVSCPNGEGFDIALLGGEALAVDTEHVNFFTPRSLARLVGACGFEVLEVATPGRLDAEFVRQAALEGRFDLSGDPFLKRVLVDEWERLGWPFQQFLAEHGLSSHMWLAARKTNTEQGA